MIVSVATRDQDRALAFYTEKLGFRLITDQPFDQDRRWIELAIGHSDTRFVLFTPPGEEHRVGDRFSGALACDDVEATHRQLSARGVEFESPPHATTLGYLRGDAGFGRQPLRCLFAQLSAPSCPLNRSSSDCR